MIINGSVFELISYIGTWYRMIKYSSTYRLNHRSRHLTLSLGAPNGIASLRTAGERLCMSGKRKLATAKSHHATRKYTSISTLHFATKKFELLHYRMYRHSISEFSSFSY